MFTRLTRSTLFASVALACGLAAASLSAEPSVSVVMDGLDNPRGMAFGPEGALYVAEAGRGGAGPCAVNAPGEFRCYGPTGAISRLWKGLQERVLTGLPSNALTGAQAGAAATGPHDIAFLGRGGAYVTLGLGGGPGYRENLSVGNPDGEYFGTLIHLSAGGQWRMVADLLAFEADTNPGAGPVDSNPFGVLAEPGARIVADAGANALNHVAANGDISTLAIFPSRAQGRATDAVPTAVVVGPDGAYYVSELSGVPFAAGAARIYRVVAGEDPEIYQAGFKTITDMAFDHDGNLYVVEHAGGPVFFGAPGQLLRVAPDGSRSVVLGGLDRPTSVVVGPDGAIYVTNHGITAGLGEVLRIEPE